MAEEQHVSVKVSMPDSLRAQFKAACALERMSMNEMIVKFIKNWLQEIEDEVPQPHRSRR
jgi:metal-responsive CopG/Arc/MetJ family transcriptional regulator